MRSAAHRTQQRWPLLLAAGVAALCASTALASRRSPADDRHGALTASPATPPVPAFTTDPAAAFTTDTVTDLAADLAPGPFHPLTRAQGVLGRITARDGAAFSYDLSGRRSEDARFTYTWDWRGRLVQVDVSPGAGAFAGDRILYAYDALGRLLQRTHLGPRPEGGSDDARPFVDARAFQWDGQGLLSETGLNFALQPLWRTIHVPGPGGLDDAVQLRVETLDPATGSVLASRLFTVVRDELGSVLSLVEDDGAAPVVTARVRYTPYGEAHVEHGPELGRARFDPTLTTLDAGGTTVAQTIASPETAEAGAVRLLWSAALDPASLEAGAVLEKRVGSGWESVAATARWIGLHPDAATELVVLPLAGWEREASYRVRLTTGITDRLNRSLAEGHLVELAIPPPGSVGAPILERAYTAAFDSAQAASETLDGAFPGGQTSLFQGLWTDPVTGIAYARARWYDARNASWLSEDPLGPVDSPNLYQAFGLDPQNNTDPLGLQTASDDPCAGEPTDLQAPCRHLADMEVQDAANGVLLNERLARDAVRRALYEHQKQLLSERRSVVGHVWQDIRQAWSRSSLAGDVRRYQELPETAGLAAKEFWRSDSAPSELQIEAGDPHATISRDLGASVGDISQKFTSVTVAAAQLGAEGKLAEGAFRLAAELAEARAARAAEKVHGHHTYVKALGGHPEQRLSDILAGSHVGAGGVHSDLAKFEGGWLFPRKGMTGRQIVDKYGREEVEKGLRRFYSQENWRHLLPDFEEAVRFTAEKAPR